MKPLYLKLCLSVSLLLLSTVLYAAEDWEAAIQSLSDGPYSADQIDQYVGDLERQLVSTAEALENQVNESDLFEPESYAVFAEQWRKLEAQAVARQQFFLYATDALQQQITGFGPVGVKQARIEGRLLVLHCIYAQYSFYHGWQRFIDDMAWSPVPLLAALLQLFIATLVWVYWCRKCIPALRSFQEKASSSDQQALSHLGQLVTWWYLRIRLPLEQWLFFSVVITCIASLWMFIDVEPLHILLNWLLLGAALLLLLDALVAARYRKRRRKDKQARLRLRSIKYLGWSVIAGGLLLALIDALGVSAVTLHAWFVVLYCWIMLPVVLVVLNWWRPVITQKLQSAEYRDKNVSRWILQRQTGVLGFVALFMGCVYLTAMGFVRYLLDVAAEKESIQSWMAYLFRVEIARQSAKEQEHSRLDMLELDDASWFSCDFSDGKWVDSVAEQELQQVAASCCSDKPTINVVFAGRGRGKSSFIRRLQAELPEQRPLLHIACEVGDFSQFIEQLGIALGFGEEATARDVVAALKDPEPIVIAIDDVQRMIKPAIGGLKELDRLVRFMSTLR